jgi:hypothetical protein
VVADERDEHPADRPRHSHRRTLGAVPPPETNPQFSVYEATGNAPFSLFVPPE